MFEIRITRKIIAGVCSSLANDKGFTVGNVDLHLYLVLHIQYGSCVILRCRWIIVQVVVIDAYGLIWSIKHTATHVRWVGPFTWIVIGNKDEVGYAVIDKGFVEGDIGPFSCYHVHCAAEHLVGLFDIDPVGVAIKWSFIGGYQIEITVAGLRGSIVVESYAIDSSGCAYFFGSIYLLGERVIVIRVTRNVIIGVRPSVAYIDIIIQLIRTVVCEGNCASCTRDIMYPKVHVWGTIGEKRIGNCTWVEHGSADIRAEVGVWQIAILRIWSPWPKNVNLVINALIRIVVCISTKRGVDSINQQSASRQSCFEQGSVVPVFQHIKLIRVFCRYFVGDIGWRRRADGI